MLGGSVEGIRYDLFITMTPNPLPLHILRDGEGSAAHGGAYIEALKNHRKSLYRHRK